MNKAQLGKVGSVAISSGAAQAAGNWLLSKFRRKKKEQEFATATLEAIDVKPALAVITSEDRLSSSVRAHITELTRRVLPGVPVMVLDPSLAITLHTAAGYRIPTEYVAARVVRIEASTEALEEWRAAALAALADATDAAIAVAGGRERFPEVATQIDRLESAALAIAGVKWPADLAPSSMVTFETHDRLVTLARDLAGALEAVIADPHGCAFCDYGILRPSAREKGHDDNCVYVRAGYVIAVARDRGLAS